MALPNDFLSRDQLIDGLARKYQREHLQFTLAECRGVYAGMGTSQLRAIYLKAFDARREAMAADRGQLALPFDG